MPKTTRPGESHADLEAKLRRHAEELEAANAALGEITARFEAVYHHHYQLTGLLSADGRLLMANRTALEFVGVTEAEVIGRPFAETIFWAHSPREQARLRDAVEQARGGEFVRFETTHVSAAGERRDFDFCISPVRDGSGEVIYLVPEGHDITERKRTEATLRERDEELRAQVESSPDWIWALDLKGVFTYCNPALQTILGYAPEEFVGRSSLQLLHPQDFARLETILPDCIGRKHGWRNVHVRWKTRDGRWRHLESSSVPILDEAGHVKGVRGVDRDISDRVEAEELGRRSEEK